jgi:hypothetical protein
LRHCAKNPLPAGSEQIADDTRQLDLTLFQAFQLALKLVGLGAAPTSSRPRWRERGSNRARLGSGAFWRGSKAEGYRPKREAPALAGARAEPLGFRGCPTLCLSALSS